MGKSLCQFWHSSIGKKIVVALTGLLLVGFLLGHMTGNLLVFVGREAMNDYAEFLRHLFHGVGIWIVRIGLLAAFFLHIFATVALTRQNKAARNEKYAHAATMRASRSSRIMIISGLIILAFVIFHILHYTVRIDPELKSLVDTDNGPKRFDTYGMVIKGFSVPWVSLFYVVAISLLCSHLSHGIASIFQTLGMRSAKTEKATKGLSWLITIVLWIGFLVIPLSILFGVLKDEKKSASLESYHEDAIKKRPKCLATVATSFGGLVSSDRGNSPGTNESNTIAE